jgi:glycine oxidase
MTYDVAIVGAGVIGCAIACELAERGAKVVLLERERVCSGASGAAAGMLAPQTEAHAPDPWFELLLAARAEHEALACKLRHETGIDVGYRRDGVLRIAADDAERRELRDRADWQRQHGLAVEWLEPEDALRMEPGLNPNIAGALWLPDEAQVQSPRLVQALALDAQRHGAEIREGVPVLAVGKDAVRTPTERLSAGAVVLAGGVGSAFVHGARLPVFPVRGQIACGQMTPICGPRHILWGAGAYLTPKAGGELLIGATEEEGTYDTRPTLGAIADLIAAGEKILPSLRHIPLTQAWAGLRPALPDRKPALGTLNGVFVATGHYRNGILLGPLTGKFMAQLILGQTPAWDLSPYSPSRFERS